MTKRSYELLEKINSPDDLKKLPEDSMDELIEELREKIIETVDAQGGHLASNLGMVEATVAIHRAFDCPRDNIIFDVGHQGYAHKLLTGRYKSFDSLRSFGGISGFTNREESVYDTFSAGHCGSSISAALGVAEAKRILGDNSYTVAVVGDGALTNGMIYEALNNCGNRKIRLIIFINDNDMSISKNVGGLHRYLSGIRTSKGYFRFKHGMEATLSKIPLVGWHIATFFKKIKDAFKRIFVKNNIFEDLGIIYLGPVDGNDLKRLSILIDEAKTKDECCVIHMKTKKGMGYAPAEIEPEKYHSVSALAGSGNRSSKSFSEYVGEELCKRASADNKICAITAAMCDGTGLTGFAAKYPDRFFDVGIAEEHAVTFAGGLSAMGQKPVLILYSTFAQRVYDQLWQDVSLQKLPMVLMLDRSGLVPGDGITHQGIFDYALFSSIPNVEIYSPETFAELSDDLDKGLAGSKITIIRYPKGSEPPKNNAEWIDEGVLSYTANIFEADTVIVTFGRMTSIAVKAAELLSGKYNVGVLKLVKIFPLDFRKISEKFSSAKLVYVLEEGIKDGGMGEKLSSALNNVNIHIHAVEGFVPHGSLDDLLKFCSFTPDEVSRKIEEIRSGENFR